MATSTPESETVVADVRPGDYGAKVIAVEPGGAEFVPLHERHGRPVHLLWTWLSPNLEFATVFLGVLATGIIGLSFWQAALAILIGTGLGAFSHAVLSARGPAYGVPQMVLSRISFGWWGNALPAGLNAVIAGIGWFAVNSVSGALALNSLTTLPSWVCLLIVVVLQIAIAFPSSMRDVRAWANDLDKARDAFSPTACMIISCQACSTRYLIEPAALGPRAGMLGAALLGWQAAGDDDAGADWSLDVLRGGSVS